MPDLVSAEGPYLAQVLAATYDIWHEGLGTAAYERFWRAQLATPFGRSRLERWALVEGAEVLASAKIYRFDATLGRRPVRVAGIGAVFTQPRHRGGGHARALIERLLDRAARDGFDLALLFSEIGADYYARLGFVAIPTTDLTLEVIEPPHRGAPATLVRAGEDRDLDDIVSMNQVRAAAFRFHLNRDRDLLHYALAKKRLLAGLGPHGFREVQFFVAEEGASAVAYAVISIGSGRWTLDEAGDRDPSGARLGALLQVLLARDPAEQRPAIRAWLPGGFCPPQVRILSRETSKDVMMMRPLSDRGKLQPPLSESDVLYWRGDVF